MAGTRGANAAGIKQDCAYQKTTSSELAAGGNLTNARATDTTAQIVVPTYTTNKQNLYYTRGLRLKLGEITRSVILLYGRLSTPQTKYDSSIKLQPGLFAPILVQHTMPLHSRPEEGRLSALSRNRPGLLQVRIQSARKHAQPLT